MYYDPANDETINYEDADFDRTDYSDCDPCYIRVNDLGLYQCNHCRAIFGGKKGITLVHKALLDLLGEGCWQEEYEELKKIRSLVNRKKFDQLQMTYLALRHNDGEVKTERRFYALKHSN